MDSDLSHEAISRFNAIEKRLDTLEGKDEEPEESEEEEEETDDDESYETASA